MMQVSQTETKILLPKVILFLIMIPVAILLIVLILPMLLVAVTAFCIISYFLKRKYVNNTYYKYVNSKLKNQNESTVNSSVSDTVIDAQYKILDDEKRS